MIAAGIEEAVVVFNAGGDRPVRRAVLTRVLAEVFELHDRQRFEVHGYSYGGHAPDDLSQRLSGAFERFVDVRADASPQTLRHGDGELDPELPEALAAVL